MAIITDPDWIDPEETTFDVEKPIRSEQGVMLAGNPIAIALGKPGAPRNLPGSLDIYLGLVTATGETASGLSDTEGVDVMSFSVGSGSIYAQFRTSVDGGAVWSDWRDLFTLPAGTNPDVYFGHCLIALQSGWWMSRASGKVDSGGASAPLPVSGGGTFTPGGVVNAVQFIYLGQEIRAFGLGAGV